jgi:uncharacterized ion transporter superfamily protein YfcC
MKGFHARFPHPLTLLVGCLLVAAALTYILPPGEYQRHEDPVTHREVVVPGTFAPVERSPVNLFEAAVAIPRGMADAASVVFLVFLIGGAFTVVDRTGALRTAIGALVRRLDRRETLVIPVSCAAFALGGALENMQEEIIAFVPLLLLLTRRLGFDALTAVAMSLGAAAVAASFSPINPFQAQIAQKLAQLPLGSGWEFRTTLMLLALGFWTWGVTRHARRTRKPPEAVELEAGTSLGWRTPLILLSVLGAFSVFLYGILRLGWDFDQLSAVFFIMGVVAGLLGRLGIRGTVDAFVEGFRSMTLAALLIGFARAISVVLEQGRILDTIVHGLSAPLANLPPAVSAIGIMAVEAGIHVPVPSVSGEAVLTLPVLVPLSDLIGLSRQVTVLAYQYGAGLCELVTPTNGALMAMLAAAGVGYDDWLKAFTKLIGGLALIGIGGIILAIAISL